MGANTFSQIGRGATAKLAFRSAVDEAAYEHGHGGYTGTLAEKFEFVEIDLPAGKDPHVYAGELINAGDDRINNKWGPAGCVKIKDGEYLFFGWASS